MSDAMERERLRARMLADVINAAFNPKEGKPTTCFVLLVAEFNRMHGGRVNYISNGNRADVVTMMKEYIARHEGRYSEAGGNA